MMNIDENIIEIKNLTKAFGEYKVLDKISFNVKKGDFIAIVGESGSGKSTLLNILGMLDIKFGGYYYFFEKNVKMTNRNEIRLHQIGFIFQLYYLIPTLSIRDNIMLPFVYMKGVNVKDKNDYFEELVNRMGLTNILDHKIGVLSGGEKQRIALCRALITNPDLIICDEPTGNLDTKNAINVIEVLKEENKKGKTVIVVTHSKEIAEYADKVYQIRGGKIENA